MTAKGKDTTHVFLTSCPPLGTSTLLDFELKLREQVTTRDKELGDANLTIQALQAKVLALSDRNKFLEDAVSQIRYQEWQTKKDLLDFHLAVIDFKKTVDIKGREARDALKKHMGFVPRSAEKRLNELQALQLPHPPCVALFACPCNGWEVGMQEGGPRGAAKKGKFWVTRGLLAVKQTNKKERNRPDEYCNLCRARRREMGPRESQADQHSCDRYEDDDAACDSNQAQAEEGWANDVAEGRIHPSTL